jgi:hypothetical protein
VHAEKLSGRAGEMKLELLMLPPRPASQGTTSRQAAKPPGKPVPESYKATKATEQRMGS